MLLCVLYWFKLAKKYNMVIISPILERDETHGDTMHNTAGTLRWPKDLIEYGSQKFTECFVLCFKRWQ